MKIEKKKVTETKSFSVAAKSALAATLGMTAAFTLNACDDSSTATSGQVALPIEAEPESSDDSKTVESSPSEESKPTSDSATTVNNTKQTGAQQTGTEQKEAQQNNTEQTESQKSSSSKAVEIPLSHEPISSSLAEAISSFLESSSSDANPASSAATPDTSATAPESSSETAQPASSSDAPSSSSAPASSSSNNGWGPAAPNPCEGLAPGDTTTYDSQIIICPSSSSQNPWSQGWSMVITFEKTDIEV
ncbi:MAG: hypothetical protein J5615_01500 [Fibrobacter sp.]|nr:hypothetical protein [Fibrobacter sp.]